MTSAILSIQSHVAYGYVGNRAAVFPLQRLGFEVWAVNTVQFSNHTGYGEWAGEVFSADHIRDVLKGMVKRARLEDCAAVLSGYMGDASLGGAILDAVAQMRTANPEMVYCCDPVIGDYGRGVFVRPGIPEFMRDHAIPQADIITPNQFELEHLTGLEVKTLQDALAAARKLLEPGPKVVLVTSMAHEETRENEIEMMAVTAAGAWKVSTPLLPLDPAPNGAGDAVSALFLARYLETRDARLALEGMAARIFEIISATHRAGTRELQLIAAQDRIARPNARFEAVQID